MSYHIDDQPGMTMQGIKLTQITPTHQPPYWKAEQEIGTLFGAEVDGGISAIGRTKEEALEHLKEERRKLHESLWE